jgi:hypothetical protein
MSNGASVFNVRGPRVQPVAGRSPEVIPALVPLATLALTARKVFDTDGDTGIDPEEFTDDDTLRFKVFGSEAAFFDPDQFSFNALQEDKDFIVASVDDANVLNVDALRDTIAFGTANHVLQINGVTVIPKVHVLDGAGASNISFVVRSASDLASQGAFMVAARARGSDGAETAVIDGDRGLVFRSDMFDGSAYFTAASINCNVDGTPSSGIVGGQWSFNVNDGVGGGNSAAMVIRATGRVGIGTSSPNVLLDVRGPTTINGGKIDADFIVWSTSAVAIWHDAGNQRLRFGSTSNGDILEMWTTKTEFNRTNLDINFQVRTSGENNTIYADGGTDRVGIHEGTPTSTFHVNGSISGPYIAKTADYTLTESDFTIDSTANANTYTLPTAVGITGRIYNVKNSSTSTITVDTTSSQTIDGSLTISIPAGAAGNKPNLQVQSTGANWIIL